MFKNMFKKKTDAEVTAEADVEVAVEDIQVVASEIVYPEQIEEVEETLSFPVLDQEPDQLEYTEEENQLISTETEMAQSSEPREWDLFTSPEVVGWSSKEEQETLFEAALWLASAPGLSVLDVGCGRADMYPLAME
jgi:hypothetical protein